MYLRYFVKVKHHISYFYNALLEYYPPYHSPSYTRVRAVMLECGEG